MQNLPYLTRLILSVTLFFTSTAAFAGSIVHSGTGEAIEFSFDEARTTLIVDGTTAGFGVRKITAEKIASYIADRRPEWDGTPLMMVSDAWYEGVIKDMFDGSRIAQPLSYFIPFLNVPAILGGVFDLAILPVRLPARLFKSRVHRREVRRFEAAVNTLRSAIATDAALPVSDEVFTRIRNLF